MTDVINDVIAGIAGRPHVAQPRISIDHVTKFYGAQRVIDDFTLDIAAGEFISLLGPSGSGKTTLLMMLAGFEAPSTGSISLDGRKIDHLPPHNRDMGVVFQDYALFPHMTVEGNVAFPLEMRRVAKADIARAVGRVLDMVQLSPMRDRRPSQLSGGQQQRVALARALVFEPRVILMDEPLGALDKQLREQMQLEIRDLHRRLELTIAFVTHDQSEALTMSDRIAILNGGRIEQTGMPRDIYDRPATRFVAEFIGETNLVQGAIQNVDPSTAVVQLDRGGTIIVPATDALRPGLQVLVSVRPERIELGLEKRPGANNWPVRVVDSIYQGDHLRLRLDGCGCLVARTDRRGGDWPCGADVIASFSALDCWVIVP
jgi:putative spermidine/putrescine transport system ATP-binding protein